MKRRKTKKIMVGKVAVGEFSKISIQSMLKLPSEDIIGNVKQALDLEKEGCDILRVAIPNKNALKLIYAIKKEIKIPLVADIHFDYRLAVESVFAGADKVRINPGNIGGVACVKEIVKACVFKNIPIRVGVNSGSLPKSILKKYSTPNVNALCDSVISSVNILEKLNFDKIIVSVKSSNVMNTIEAYEFLSQKIEYPLHLGVTEAGSETQGVLKSSCAIGSLLTRGIGDTIRVTLTDEPKKEIDVAKELLAVLGMKKNGIEIISCPTCGRTKVDLMDFTKKVKNHFKDSKKNIKLALMGCAVNGPGEASEADLGVAFGENEGIIFKNGKILKKVSYNYIFEELVKVADDFV
ncbi:MAG: flavodoxin-dependent (E)-4-hydroxy-3-methylbut-2-enyl-diphosphate synthase [Oscillospiraceae bacterium]|nr:flavodoxin-dependent (E)-4-hydroxy-3-methylbut-2-enyl-diphosphate synthase [Oscillospiraceae bacterium]